jgi:nucleotide-binding universal stress UspA family protein
MASSPEIRITAMAPAPEGVANATMESCGIILFNQFYAKVSKTSNATRYDSKSQDINCNQMKLKRINSTFFIFFLINFKLSYCLTTNLLYVMKKILFPTDFSKTANNAFIYALKLAENINAEIITLHVYELPIIDNQGFPSYLFEIYDTIEISNFENYKDQVPLLREIAEKNNLDHVKMSHVLQQGSLVAVIDEIAKKDHIDYIVMGTKGASGLKEKFIGSNTGGVIANVSPFVLAIPEHSHFHPIKQIAFTTGFKDKDRIGLRNVLEIARGFDATVYCLYVKTPNSKVTEDIIQDWKTDFDDQNVVFHIVENEDVKEAILKFTKKNKIDVLAMLDYKRGFFEELFAHSLTQKIAFEIDIPILALHAKDVGKLNKV